MSLKYHSMQKIKIKMKDPLQETCKIRNEDELGLLLSDEGRVHNFLSESQVHDPLGPRTCSVNVRGLPARLETKKL